MKPHVADQGIEVRQSRRSCRANSPGSYYGLNPYEMCMLAGSPSSDGIVAKCLCENTEFALSPQTREGAWYPAGGALGGEGPSSVAEFIDSNPILIYTGFSSGKAVLPDWSSSIGLHRVELVPGLSTLFPVLVEEFSGRVDGVFLTNKQDDNSWSVLVVVDRHTDEVYDFVVGAEDRIAKDLRRTDISFQVRARKGRPVLSLVPPDSFQVPLG